MERAGPVERAENTTLARYYMTRPGYKVGGSFDSSKYSCAMSKTAKKSVRRLVNVRPGQPGCAII